MSTTSPHLWQSTNEIAVEYHGVQEFRNLEGNRLAPGFRLCLGSPNIPGVPFTTAWVTEEAALAIGLKLLGAVLGANGDDCASDT